ncbi:hypothetical protein [uncultured Jannaschia sp.]|uniref:hypothetical protein n=1 Tax=uncultured Jannaschia sp. TaxID=293347 RepID=UPI00262398DD|nr:hypothetical protein [uncultured Jannaschia sp.]
MRRDPIKRHRFPRDVILLARPLDHWFPLSCQDVRDLMTERGITVDQATGICRVRTFGPEIAMPADDHRSWRQGATPLARG